MLARQAYCQHTRSPRSEAVELRCVIGAVPPRPPRILFLLATFGFAFTALAPLGAGPPEAHRSKRCAGFGGDIISALTLADAVPPLIPVASLRGELTKSSPQTPSSGLPVAEIEGIAVDWVPKQRMRN